MYDENCEYFFARHAICAGRPVPVHDVKTGAHGCEYFTLRPIVWRVFRYAGEAKCQPILSAAEDRALFDRQSTHHERNGKACTGRWILRSGHSPGGWAVGRRTSGSSPVPPWRDRYWEVGI